jgi:hypothetical protein
MYIVSFSGLALTPINLFIYLFIYQWAVSQRLEFTYFWEEQDALDSG